MRTFLYKLCKNIYNILKNQHFNQTEVKNGDKKYLEVKNVFVRHNFNVW